MDQFATEEQQAEAIKRFFKDNGFAIAAGVILGFGGLWGWRYYADDLMTSKEQASNAYQEAVESSVAAESPEALASFVEQTKEQGYKSLAAFVIAKEYVDDNNLDAAADVLQDILVAEQSSPLAAIAALRLAAIQMQQGEYDAVLSTLENVAQPAFSGQKLTLKGDALAALSRIEDAKQAYTEALEQTPSDKQVQMKLDNLALSGGV